MELLQELQTCHRSVLSQAVLGRSCLPSPAGLGQTLAAGSTVGAGAMPSSTFPLTRGSHHSLRDFEGTTPGAEAVPTVTAAPLWRERGEILLQSHSQLSPANSSARAPLTALPAEGEGVQAPVATAEGSSANTTRTNHPSLMLDLHPSVP